MPPLDVREHVRTNTKSNKRQPKALTRLFHGQQLHSGLKTKLKSVDHSLQNSAARTGLAVYVLPPFGSDGN